jgi:hypothetical protein
VTTVEERLSRLEGVYEHLATKSDVFDLKADLLAEIARTETRLTSEIASVETRLTSEIASVETRLTSEIASVETRLTSEIASVETRLIRWTVGLVLGGMTAICALTIVIAKFVN